MVKQSRNIFSRFMSWEKPHQKEFGYTVILGLVIGVALYVPDFFRLTHIPLPRFGLNAFGVLLGNILIGMIVAGVLITLLSAELFPRGRKR